VTIGELSNVIDLIDDPTVQRKCEWILIATLRHKRDKYSAAKTAAKLRRAAREYSKGKQIQLDAELLSAAGFSEPLPPPATIPDYDIDSICVQFREMASYNEELAKQTGQWIGGKRQIPGIRYAVTCLHEVFISHTGKQATATREYETRSVTGPFANFVKEAFRRFYSDMVPPWTAIDDAIVEIVDMPVELNEKI
jgi:hypothetical protein